MQETARITQEDLDLAQAKHADAIAKHGRRSMQSDTAAEEFADLRRAWREQEVFAGRRNLASGVEVTVPRTRRRKKA